MHHIAIMNPSWKLIPKIVAGEKTIESRWYQTRRAPWNSISAGDTIYFKNSGEKVTASATVEKVLQFEIGSVHDAEKIISQYGKQICLVNTEPKTWGKQLRYCILIFLKNPHALATPLQINKKGFGNGAAWLVVPDIRDILIA